MTFSFGLGDRGGQLETGVPVLGGEPTELLADRAEAAGREGLVRLWRGRGLLAGFAREDAGADLEGATARMYADILRAARGANIFRIWNFVPRINENGPGGLENYRSFCRGRSLAFEGALGPRFREFLPAASAVGGPDGWMAVAFLACAGPVRHFENPAQVPAYLYPPEHGPRPPSFARATVVERHGGLDAYISGTSAIVGHETVCARQTLAQLDRTIANLSLIARACGLGESLGSGRACARHFKVYLRHGEEMPVVAEALAARLLAPGDRVSYLRADICREELNVEVELAVRGAPRA